MAKDITRAGQRGSITATATVAATETRGATATSHTDATTAVTGTGTAATAAATAADATTIETTGGEVVVAIGTTVVSEKKNKASPLQPHPKTYLVFSPLPIENANIISLNSIRA